MASKYRPIITKLQHQLLIRAENGIITFAQARGNGNLQSMHLLTAKGILEHVPAAPNETYGSWRLTTRGAALLEGLSCPFNHAPNAETIAAMEEIESGGGEVHHGTVEELFENILSDDGNGPELSNGERGSVT